MTRFNQSEVGMVQGSNSFEYSNKLYVPCGFCDVCTMPELAYSDCGQPVTVAATPSEPLQEYA